MIKGIIFDTDGMVVKAQKFTDKYCAEFGVDYAEILPFFKNEFQPCLVGKADLKEQIKPYLAKWGWQDSVETFLNYWFKAEHDIDQRLVAIISKLRQSGIKCYLATNQEHYRTEYLKNEMGFAAIFDRIFSSAEIGYKKPQVELFDFIVKESGLAKNELQFWDDMEKNVQGAKDYGLDARTYKGFEDFQLQLASLHLI